MLHVDIIKADPLTSGEHRLVRVVLADGRVEFDYTADPAYWRQTLEHALQIDSDAEPERFFEALPDMGGTYIYVTKPHDEAICQFDHSPQPEGVTA